MKTARLRFSMYHLTADSIPVSIFTVGSHPRMSFAFDMSAQVAIISAGLKYRTNLYVQFLQGEFSIY